MKIDLKRMFNTEYKKHFFLTNKFFEYIYNTIIVVYCEVNSHTNKLFRTLY